MITSRMQRLPSAIPVSFPTIHINTINKKGDVEWRLHGVILASFPTTLIDKEIQKKDDLEASRSHSFPTG
jgi:hypothetical protein